jgi:hypothetical protein
MKELIKKLDLMPNVKKITYETATHLWYIHYKNGLKPDQVTTDELLNALTEE